jgi:hypothetical protein
MFESSFTAICDACGFARSFCYATETQALSEALGNDWVKTKDWLYCPACTPWRDVAEPTTPAGPEQIALTIRETLEHHLAVTVDELDAALPGWRVDPTLLEQDDAQSALASLYLEHIGDATVSAVSERTVTVINAPDGDAAASR